MAGLQIVEVVGGTQQGRTVLPYRILELFESCDGPRTRVCEQSYATMEEALTFLDAYLVKAWLSDPEAR